MLSSHWQQAWLLLSRIILLLMLSISCLCSTRDVYIQPSEAEHCHRYLLWHQQFWKDGWKLIQLFWLGCSFHCWRMHGLQSSPTHNNLRWTSIAVLSLSIDRLNVVLHIIINCKHRYTAEMQFEISRKNWSWYVFQTSSVVAIPSYALESATTVSQFIVCSRIVLHLCHSTVKYPMSIALNTVVTTHCTCQ